MGLIELNGDDLRRDPLNVRKATLASVLARAARGLRLNEHLEAAGPDVFHHACMLGLEGIVSKRKDSQYRSGRSPHWIKSKNPNAPAVLPPVVAWRPPKTRQGSRCCRGIAPHVLAARLTSRQGLNPRSTITVR